MRYMGIIIHIKVWGVSVWWGSPLGHSVWWESSVSLVDGGSVMVSWYWSCLGDSGPAVRVHLRPGTYHVLVLMELRWICGMGAQGDGSLLNALSRKCYMCMLQYVHRGTLP